MADRETTRDRKGTRGKSKMTENIGTANERSILPAAPIKQKTAKQKEVATMAEQETGSAWRFTGIVDSTLSAVRGIAARYIDTNASFAKQMLEFQAQTTSWAKDTPLAPMFQSQYSFGEGLIDLWAGAARALWRIEEAKSEIPDGGI
jgi:hypothetical protein